MGYRPKEINTELDNVKYEQYCNSIASRLSQLDNPDEVDCKRWPWELLQNAKDTIIKRPEDKRFVDIKIRYYINEQGKHELYFEHNGEQFTPKAIVGLIWKFSAEKRDEEITEDGLKRDKQSTGRFGTGFLTTHALSRIIKVSGSMKDSEKNRNISVEFTLHREGPDDEQYKKGVRQTEDESKYDHIPINEPQPTRFTYYLRSDQNIKAAEMGIDNIRCNSAQTMLFCPTVRSIEVIDDVRHNHFNIKRINLENKTDKIKITTFEETRDGLVSERTFISSEIDEYSKELSIYWHTDNRHMRLNVAIETDKDKKIIPVPFDTTPSVYCSLPLVGFEHMTLPFYVNSNDFEPTTERTALYLNQLKSGQRYDDAKNSNVDVVYNNGVNWAILERSVTLYEELVDYLIEEGFSDRFNLLSGLNVILKPNVWKDEELNCLAARFVLPLRQMLFDKELVLISGKYRKLNSDIVFPECSEARNPKALYEICSAIYDGNMAKFEDNQSWLKMKWSKFENWAANFDEKKDDNNPIFPSIGYKNVANYIEKAESLDNLKLTLNKEDSKVKWLNRFYLWISDAKLSTLTEKAIVPNRKGKFCTCKAEDNFKDASDIPITIFEFMKKIQIDWDENLLYEEIENVSLGKETKDHIVSAIREQTRTFVNESKSSDEILNAVLPVLLALPGEKGESNSSFYQKREQIISILSTIFPQKTANKTSDILDLKSSCWEIADNWFMKYASETIASKKKLDIIEESDSEDDKKNKYCTVSWLEKTVNFMIDNGYLHQEDISSSEDKPELSIIPNVYGAFCPLNNLHTKGNVPDELFSPTMKNIGKDINDGLIHQAFNISKKIHVDEYSLSDWTGEYTAFFEQENNLDNQKIVANYLIHIRPSNEDSLEKLRNLYDWYESPKEKEKVKTISTSDMDVWKGAKIFVINYLAKQTEDKKNLQNLHSHLYAGSSERDNNAPKGEIELGLKWVEELYTYLDTSKLAIDSEYELIPDFDGQLHKKEDIIYDGAQLKKYKNINSLVQLLTGDLWKYFTNKRAEDENLPQKISHPDFKHSGNPGLFNKGTANVLFGLIDRMVTYCYNNWNPDSKKSVKEAVETLQSFFEDYKGDSSRNNAKQLEEDLRSMFPETYKMMGDMLVNLVYDRDTRERLNRINDKFTPEEQDKLVKYNDEIKKSLNEFRDSVDTPNGIEITITPKPVEITLQTKSGDQTVLSIKERQYSGLSLEEIVAHLSEAKQAVVNYLNELNENKKLGWTFDKDEIARDSYSQLYGIYDRNGNEIPLVVHSYKGPQYRYFDLNWFDWQLLNKPGAMLWVNTITGLQCIPFYALPIRNFNISIESCTSKSEQAKLLALATVSKEYAYISFEFGNNMPKDFVDPVAFNYIPEQLKSCIDSIKKICDDNTQTLTGLYNYGANIPLSTVSCEEYSSALRAITDESTMREIHDLPANDMEKPVNGAGLEDIM